MPDTVTFACIVFIGVLAILYLHWLASLPWEGQGEEKGRDATPDNDDAQ